MEKIVGHLVKDYKLGGIGPGGGRIFYYDPKGFTMTDNNQICHYLEAALEDMPTLLEWAFSGTGPYGFVSDALGTDIGTGRENTASIIGALIWSDTLQTACPAIYYCKTYSGGGKHDWFLPSIDELEQLCIKKDYFGNFNTTLGYWSSSQYNGGVTSAWYYEFLGVSGPLWSLKDNTWLVRPIRAF